MNPVVVLCPTRGRPAWAARLAQTFSETAALSTSELLLVVDESDPDLPAYRRLPSLVLVVQGGSLTAATNEAAATIWDADVIIGHVGDDHAFRTPGWDQAIASALIEPGVAYGDDLLQGPVLPTAAFLSAQIPRALGWYALPGTRHMKIDTAWKELGQRLGRLHYLPDVVIEHLHPAAGKAPEDVGYAAARESRKADKDAYASWIAKRAQGDIERVRLALSR